MRKYSLSIAVLCCPGFATAGIISIDDIVTHDPLGYECVEAQYLIEEDPSVAPIAFQLSGKIALPRTCLPDPCNNALTQAELSDITGTDRRSLRFENEWEDYYTRYADYCRRETNPSPQGSVSADASELDFWEPIISPPQIIATNFGDEDDDTSVLSSGTGGSSPLQPYTTPGVTFDNIPGLDVNTVVSIPTPTETTSDSVQIAGTPQTSGTTGGAENAPTFLTATNTTQTTPTDTSTVTTVLSETSVPNGTGNPQTPIPTSVPLPSSGALMLIIFGAGLVYRRRSTAG